MADEFVEKIRYEADITDLQAKINRIGDEQSTLERETGTATGRMSGHWGKLRGGLGVVGDAAKTVGVGLLGIAGAAAVFGPKILSGGAELDAMGKKASTVFSGGSLKQVQSWADGVASSMGITQARAVGLATDVADLLKPMGFTADQAGAMSTKLVDLSGALSAWTGGTQSASQVSDVLTKALLGETDGLKGLGISISAADVSARLAALGQEALTGAALEQAEAMAIQELIFEKSTDAQKAWSDGSMDDIKRQAERKAKLAQLAETFTKLLYPAVDGAVGLLQKLGVWLGDKLPAFIDTVRKGWEFFVGGLTGESTNEGSGVLLFLNRLGMGLGVVVDWVKGHWPQIREIAVQVMRTIGGAITFVATKAIPALIGALRNIASWLMDHKPILIGIAAAIGVGLVAAIGAWTVATWAQVAVLWAQAAAFVAAYAPIIAVAAAIGALVAGVIYAYQEWDWFRETVDKVATFFKDTVWPILQDVFGWLNDNVPPIMKTIGDTIVDAFGVAKSAYDNVLKPTFDAVWAIIEYAWGVAKPIIEAIGTVISAQFAVAEWAYDNVLKPIWNTIGSVVSTGWGVAQPIIEAIGTVVATAFGVAKTAYDTVLKPMFDAISSTVTGVKDWVGARLDDIVGFFTGMPARIVTAAAGMFNGIKEAFRSAINWIIGVWNGLEFKIPGFDPPGPGPKFGGFTLGVPNIPLLHTGGLVGGMPGEEKLFKLLAGETVRTERQERDVQSRLNGDSRSVQIGVLQLTTTESPRRFYDEGLWRVAG